MTRCPLGISCLRVCHTDMKLVILLVEPRNGRSLAYTTGASHPELLFVFFALDVHRGFADLIGPFRRIRRVVPSPLPISFLLADLRVQFVQHVLFRLLAGSALFAAAGSATALVRAVAANGGIVPDSLR